VRRLDLFDPFKPFDPSGLFDPVDFSSPFSPSGPLGAKEGQASLTF